MSQISSRIYGDETDLPIMLDLIANVRPAAYRNDHPVRADIEENLATSAIRLNTRIWLDNNQPVGWAYVDEFNNLWWELDRQYEERLGEEIVGWGESCLRKSLTQGETSNLDTNCREDYAERISFLYRYDFEPTGEFNISMRRQLSEPMPALELPEGFVIRPIRGTHEAEAVATMHRAAFGTDNMTTEKRLAIMSTSEYDPTLDLIVVAPDGKFAANCICSGNAEKGIGNTDPIMTHPRF